MPQPQLIIHEEPGVFLLSQIYSPLNAGLNPDGDGRIVPAVGSIIMDDTRGVGDQRMYQVAYLSSPGYRPYLIEHTRSVPAATRVYDQGNELLVMYKEPNSVTLGAITYHYMIPDQRLRFLGSYTELYYVLCTLDGTEISYPVPSGVTVASVGTPIALMPGDNNWWGISSCLISDVVAANHPSGNMVLMRVYDGNLDSSQLVSEFRLTVRDGGVLSDTVVATDVITGIEFYYGASVVTDLTLTSIEYDGLESGTPLLQIKISKNSGSEEFTGNVFSPDAAYGSLKIYGYEGISPTHLLAKLFLPRPSWTSVPTGEGSERFLTADLNITISDV